MNGRECVQKGMKSCREVRLDAAYTRSVKVECVCVYIVDMYFGFFKYDTTTHYAFHVPQIASFPDLPGTQHLS